MSNKTLAISGLSYEEMSKFTDQELSAIRKIIGARTIESVVRLSQRFLLITYTNGETTLIAPMPTTKDY